MINRIPKSPNWYLLVMCVSLACLNTALAQNQSTAKHKQQRAKPAPDKTTTAGDVAQAKIIGKRIHFVDGSVVQADEVWKNGDDLWYRVGSITQRVARAVKSVEAIHAPVEKAAAEDTADASKVQGTSKPPVTDSVWVLLKGGARMKADEVTESDEGAWCRRGNFSVLIARDRIERIEHDAALANPRWKQRDWTTGNGRIDQLIRTNASRFGIDPYLVFCVIEHESQFHTRAISPKGAQGLMQLMPGTAARFGVRNPFDPAQNIYGGTQYLKELLKMFSGRVDLALASYNAGEGAVLKYGRKVPPYRETREYVKRITRRYGSDITTSQERRSP